MDRVILHADCNKFFASVECLHRPEIRHLPVAVGGNEEKRHGIVLTANAIAVSEGVRTAEPLWQAKRKCPGLIVVPPNYPLYLRFSKLAREIYAEYTDLVEPFGLDECWLDLSAGVGGDHDGKYIAEKIRKQIKKELGITVSIGVSWNKVYAKLGSDYRKPDAVTVFSRENYKRLIYPLPAASLLYVGKATERKLTARGIFTIGDIARCEPRSLCDLLGKNGLLLHSYAAGYDNDPVSLLGAEREVKSIGNSTTTPRDLVTPEDVRLTLTVIAECVARRLREHGLKCKTVCLWVRDNNLQSFTRQLTLDTPTCSAKVLIDAGMALFLENMTAPFAVRSIGLTGLKLCSPDESVQFDLFGDVKKNERTERLEKTVDELKFRFGSGCVKKASLLTDRRLTDFEPHDDIQRTTCFEAVRNV